MNLTIGLDSEFACAARILGDVRRSTRMISMVRGVMANPRGQVSAVFSSPAEQQGAYDFLEHDTVKSTAVQKVVSAATARLCRGEDVVFTIFDGSSVTLTDNTLGKGFGSIGSRQAGALGLKMLTALALDSQGRTIGVLGQDFWARPEEPAHKGYRSLESRESHRWVELLGTAQTALAEHAPGARMHVLGDREADASELMRQMLERNCSFTIRSNGTRHVRVEGDFVPLMPLLKQQKAVASMTIEIPRTGNRPARTATLTVRSMRVETRLQDKHTGRRKVAALTVVWAYEQRPPRGVERLSWLLFTTEALEAKTVSTAVVHYTRRWRIEEFHKALKSGGGCVEDSQLRSAAAVIKWVTLHSMAAVRAQRLRDLAKTSPDAPASIELSLEEIEALVLLKTKEKRRTETVTADGLTIRLAVRWIGDLGGFAATGVSTKMPGPTVIGRGLDRVHEAAGVIRALRDANKIR